MTIVCCHLDHNQSNFSVFVPGESEYKIPHSVHVTRYFYDVLSLMRALMSKDGRTPTVDGEGITDGIDIAVWSIKQSGQPLTYSVWDFAGQTVYYNTHQVREKALQALILISSKEIGLFLH